MIRKATLQDVKAITSLSDELGYVSRDAAIRTRLTSILASYDHCLLVITKNDQVQGLIHAIHAVRVESDAFVEITGLVVSEKYRGQGLGKLLVQQILRWASTMNCTKVRVRTNSKRVDAPLFYEKIGFTNTKDQRIFDLEIS